MPASFLRAARGSRASWRLVLGTAHVDKAGALFHRSPSIATADGFSQSHFEDIAHAAIDRALVVRLAKDGALAVTGHFTKRTVQKSLARLVSLR